MLKNKIIGKNISILYRNKSNYVDKQIKKFNINTIQVEVLLFVRDNPTTNLTEINKFYRFNKATITKTIKHLEKEHYVKTCVNKYDRREKFITLTEKGDSILPEIIKVFNYWEFVVLKDITLEDIEITRNVLSKMVENLLPIKEEIK